MTDEHCVELKLENGDLDDLRQILANRVSGRMVKQASGWFSYTFSGKDIAFVRVKLNFEDRDTTEFGATLRKIRRPALLNQATRQIDERLALEFLERMADLSASSLRYSGCEYYEDCLDFVLALCSQDNAFTKYKKIAEQGDKCLGFACVQCPNFKKELDLKEFSIKQPSVWEVSFERFIFGLA
ncbi:MAG: hypothetical protein MUC28_02330 [Planctomycetes bacterium]|jgi:hypothetical protein|nr:hypothetical protein [Planctomycetota bacterium]